MEALLHMSQILDHSDIHQTFHMLTEKHHDIPNATLKHQEKLETTLMVNRNTRKCRKQKTNQTCHQQLLIYFTKILQLMLSILRK